MPILYDLVNLVKEYGTRRVLDIDSIGLQQGVVYALRGPNGAGKSTLLSLLAFLDTPSDGVIRFGGQDVNYTSGTALHQLRQRVVLVDQSPLLFSGSVYQNVEFGLRVRKVNRNERRERVERALEQVGMLGFTRHDARKLSGGETKRVALARGLAVSPAVLLLDEPAANVDLENQAILFEIISRVNKTFATTIIYSTHQSPLDEHCGHQTLILEKGKLHVERQKNMFDGRVKIGNGNRSVCKLAGCSIEVELPNSLLTDVGEVFSLYIDPEKIVLLDSSTAPQKNSFGAEVFNLTREGKNVNYTVHVGQKLFVSSSYRSYKENPFHLGQAVMINLPDDAFTIYPLKGPA